MSEQAVTFYATQAHAADFTEQLPPILRMSAPISLSELRRPVALVHDTKPDGSPMFNQAQDRIISQYRNHMRSVDPYIAATTAAPLGGNENFNHRLDYLNALTVTKLFGHLLAAAELDGSPTQSAHNFEIGALSPHHIPGDILAKTVACHKQAAEPEHYNRLAILLVTAEQPIRRIGCLAVVHGVPNMKFGPSVHYTSTPLNKEQLAAILNS